MKIKSICGVILTSECPKELAEFYSKVFGIPFEEEHSDLEKHYGADIGELHLGIHPPDNMGMSSSGNASVSIAYNIDSIAEIIARLEELGAEQILPPHDEGFGMVASYKDPDGNLFEIVELNYDFAAS